MGREVMPLFPRVLKGNEMDESVFAGRQLAVEACLSELVASAKRHGLNPSPVMGLNYLPSQELTWQFQTACNKVLTSLGVREESASGK